MSSSFAIGYACSLIIASFNMWMLCCIEPSVKSQVPRPAEAPRKVLVIDACDSACGLQWPSVFVSSCGQAPDDRFCTLGSFCTEATANCGWVLSAEALPLHSWGSSM